MECAICFRTSEEGYDITTDCQGSMVCRDCLGMLTDLGIYDPALNEMAVWEDVDTDTTWEEWE